MAGSTPFPVAELARSLETLKGVGPKSARRLRARGLRTWGDLLLLLPTAYQDRRHPRALGELGPTELGVGVGRVVWAGRWGRTGKVYRMVLEDQGRRLECVWFNWRGLGLERFERGQGVVAVGRVDEGPRGLRMVHPEVYSAEEVDQDKVGVILPVYPSVGGLRQGVVRRLAREVASRCCPAIDDPLPELLPRELYPMPVGQALLELHIPPPDTDPSLLSEPLGPWRKVVAVNELIYYELAMAMATREVVGRSRPLNPPGELLRRFIAQLPFELTPSQAAAIDQLRQDMASGRLTRILAGDVGTGKTVVAAAACCLGVEAGVRCAFMAPTELLAMQHAHTLGGWLGPLGVRVGVVTAGCREGWGADVVVGTHALIGTHSRLEDVGLVIIDEQQRFGVNQRLALAAKAEGAHLLVLSATPIPRTLAMALRGQMQISTLEPRPGTGRVETVVVGFEHRREAVRAIEQAVARGEQVFVVCPALEAGERMGGWDAVGVSRRLEQYLKGPGVGLVHGRMAPGEQQQVVEAFRQGRVQVLVATSVVEVGVDVAGARVMVVLGAERFGLTQLHQLRGRVGRDGRGGRCILVVGPKPTDQALRRLKVLEATSEGLAIAEADLMMRGPGEVLGLAQSGPMPLVSAPQWVYLKLLGQVRIAVEEWMEVGLEKNELAAVASEARRRWGEFLGLVQAG